MPLNDSAAGRVIMDPVAVAAWLRSPSGPVVELLIRRATRVQEAAVRQVRLGHIHGGNTGRGNLRSSIVKRIVPDNHGDPSVLVGSDNPIAMLHHQGTRPHIIRPRNTKYLRFFSNSANAFVFAREVHHPGTQPNHYLLDNIGLAVNE